MGPRTDAAAALRLVGIETSLRVRRLVIEDERINAGRDERARRRLACMDRITLFRTCTRTRLDCPSTPGR